MANASRKVRPRRGPGRLSIEETAALPDRLLDAAQKVFVDEGYAGATMEAIAKAAGASRKTIYARYPSKEDVLAAVIQRFLDAAMPAGAGLPQNERSDDPRSTLMSIGRNLAAAVSLPDTAGFNRLIMTEAYRYPQLAKLALQLQGVAVAEVRATLEQFHAQGQLPALADPQPAAQIFIEMVVSIQRRNAMLGVPTPRKESDALIERAVEIFLTGPGR